MCSYIVVLFVIYHVCAAYTDVRQQDHLKISEVGGSVNLSCFTSKASRGVITWMKQKLGEKPLLIATSYQEQSAVYYNDFNKNARFKILLAADIFYLSISNIEPSDSATYYCASIFIYDISFGDGTYLLVKGASMMMYEVLQQPVKNPVRPGDSATLECTVNTQGCSEEHSVYWFRHGSHPGIIFTHGNRSDQCKKSSETVSPTQSCVYKLPKNNLSLSDAGTYYCAVAACGEILFGNGTKIDFTGNDALKTVRSIPLVLILSNVFFLLAIIMFVVLQCKKQEQSEGLTRRHRKTVDTEEYSQVIYHQQS